MTRAVTTGSTVGSLLALSVLLRALFPGVAVPSVPASPTSPAAASPTTPAPAPADPGLDDGPWKASQRFFAGGVPECDAKSAAPRTKRWCIPDDTSVLALIAIAPDPVRTHMALQFDRALEAIELAAGSAGYVISQYWLPWSVDLPKASDAGKSSDINGSEVALRLSGRRHPDQWRRRQTVRQRRHLSRRSVRASVHRARLHVQWRDPDHRPNILRIARLAQATDRREIPAAVQGVQRVSFEWVRNGRPGA
jgi:hypothetical protein